MRALVAASSASLALMNTYDATSTTATHMPTPSAQSLSATVFQLIEGPLLMTAKYSPYGCPTRLGCPLTGSCIFVLDGKKGRYLSSRIPIFE